MYAYHVVTDRPINPSQYDVEALEHHTSVALRELALEEVRLKNIRNILQEWGVYMFRIPLKRQKNGGIFLLILVDQHIKLLNWR